MCVCVCVCVWVFVMWVCVCVGFVMCVCVCVCVCVGFCNVCVFGNMCSCIYRVLYCLFYVYLFLFFLSVLV